MGSVILVMSMSLDGYINAANVRPEEPMGDGGLRLHDWLASDDPRDREVLSKGVSGLGAVIAGRRTYDLSVPWWGADGPTGPARLPVFVVSHNEPTDAPAGGVYIFIDGIEAALARAREAAGEKYLSVMGGADLGQQYLRAGLIDEIQIHLVPVVFGSGTRLFEHLGGEHIPLETLSVVNTPAATHLRYRVVKSG
jgi:dihydrofolate reductase